MNIIIMSSLSFILSSCSALPGLFQSVDDIATDTAIKIEIDKAAISRDTEIHITLDITNPSK